MSDKQNKKPGAASELDLIKSALSANLDETTVDIFAQDLFGKPEPEKKKTEEAEKQKPAEPRQKPAAPGLRPAEPELKSVDAEEIKLASLESRKPEAAREPEPARKEKLEPELSWEKPPGGQTLLSAKESQAGVPAPRKQTPSSAPAKPAPAIKTPPAKKPAPEMELKIEAGEFHAVAAVKEEAKLDQTGEILMQLEKMGADFLSAQEMKKLFSNVNLMIELLNKALSRIEQIERKLKEKGIL